MPRTSLRRTLSRILPVVALLLSVVSVAAADTEAVGRPFANPVKAQKGADPWIEYHDGDVGLIDSSVPELNGQRYPLGSAWGSTQNLVIAPMSNPYTVSGALTTISAPTYAWERQDGTEDWIVYHANDAAGDGCDNNRTTRAQKFTWSADGTPNRGTPVRLGTTVDGPAGETAATPVAYTVVNRNSGKCLQVSGSADGAVVRQWSWLANNCRQWRLQPV